MNEKQERDIKALQETIDDNQDRLDKAQINVSKLRDKLLEQLKTPDNEQLLNDYDINKVLWNSCCSLTNACERAISNIYDEIKANK